MAIARSGLRADPRLLDALRGWGRDDWWERESLFLEATQAEAFTIMSLVSAENAAALLAHPRITTGPAALRVLKKWALLDLIEDRQEIVKEAAARQWLSAESFLAFARRFSSEGIPVTRYVDAAEMRRQQVEQQSDSGKWWSIKNAELHDQYVTAVLLGEVTLEVMGAIGAFAPDRMQDPAGSLEAAKRLCAAGEAFDVSDLRRLLLKHGHGSLDLAARFGVAFVLEQQETDGLRAVLASAHDWNVEGQRDAVLQLEEIRHSAGAGKREDMMRVALQLAASRTPLEATTKLLGLRLSLGQLAEAARRRSDYRMLRELGTAPFPPLPRLHVGREEARAFAEATVHPGTTYPLSKSLRGGPWPALTALGRTREWREAADPELAALCRRVSPGPPATQNSDLDAYEVLAAASLGNALCFLTVANARSLLLVENLVDEHDLWHLVEDNTEVVSAMISRRVLPEDFMRFALAHPKPSGCPAALYAEAAELWGRYKGNTTLDYSQAVLDGRMRRSDLIALGGPVKVDCHPQRAAIVEELRKAAHGESEHRIEDLAYAVRLRIASGITMLAEFGIEFLRKIPNTMEAEHLLAEAGDGFTTAGRKALIIYWFGLQRADPSAPWSFKQAADLFKRTIPPQLASLAAKRVAADGFVDFVLAVPYVAGVEYQTYADAAEAWLSTSGQRRVCAEAVLAGRVGIGDLRAIGYEELKSGRVNAEEAIDRVGRIRQAYPDFDSSALREVVNRFGAATLDLVEVYGADFVLRMPSEESTRAVLSLLSHLPRIGRRRAGEYWAELATRTSPSAFTAAEVAALWLARVPAEYVLKLKGRFGTDEILSLSAAGVPAEYVQQLKGRFATDEILSLSAAGVPASRAVELSANDLLSVDQIVAMRAHGVPGSIIDGWL